MAATEYVVKPGDSLIKIAHAHGFPTWATIWEAPENAALRARRPDPQTLAPGDKLSIPDKEPKAWDCQADEKHVFRLRTQAPLVLRLVIKDDEGQAYANARYKLELPGMPVKEGTIADDGVIEAEGKPDCGEAKLSLWLDPDQPDVETKLKIMIGQLDPVTEVPGVKARLNNLGFECGAIDAELSDATKAALRDFQEFIGVKPSGELNEETRNALVQLHGR